MTFLLSYKLAVEKNAVNIGEGLSVDTSLLKLFQVFTDSATEAAEKTFKEVKRNVFAKHWWTPELIKTKMVFSTHFKIWRDAGLPNDGGPIHSRYLLARKNFRKQVKYTQNKEIYEN